jgi:hypothetical protein
MALQISPGEGANPHEFVVPLLRTPSRSLFDLD